MKKSTFLLSLCQHKKLGVNRALVAPGRVLNRDMLRGKVKVDGKQTEITILAVDKKDGIEFALLDTHERTRGLTIEYRIKLQSIGEKKSEVITPRSLT